MGVRGVLGLLLVLVMGACASALPRRGYYVDVRVLEDGGAVAIFKGHYVGAHPRSAHLVRLGPTSSPHIAWSRTLPEGSNISVRRSSGLSVGHNIVVTTLTTWVSDHVVTLGHDLTTGQELWRWESAEPELAGITVVSDPMLHLERWQRASGSHVLVAHRRDGRGRWEHELESIRPGLSRDYPPQLVGPYVLAATSDVDSGEIARTDDREVVRWHFIDRVDGSPAGTAVARTPVCPVGEQVYGLVEDSLVALRPDQPPRTVTDAVALGGMLLVDCAAYNSSLVVQLDDDRRSTLVRIDPQTGDVLRRIPLRGRLPSVWRRTFHGPLTRAMPLFHDGQITVVDLEAGRVAAWPPVEDGSYGYLPEIVSTDRVHYLIDDDRRIAALDGATGLVMSMVDLPRRSGNLEARYHGHGRLYFTSWGCARWGDSPLVMDAATLEVVAQPRRARRSRRHC